MNTPSSSPALAPTGLPSSESEQWRYSPVGDLPLDRLSVCATPPDGEVAPGLADDQAAMVVLVDGHVGSITVADGWAAKGLTITVDADRSVDYSIEADREPTVFDAMHAEHAPAAVVISIPNGVSVDEPIMVDNRHQTDGGISLPHLVVEIGEAASATIIERQYSAEGEALSLPVTELTVGPASNLTHVVIQDHGRSHWQIGRQLSTVDGQATLASGLGAFGGHYARLRVDSRLVGRGATASMSSAYYGDDDQTQDFRVFQHHDARDTRSDLLFKGTQDDRSGSVYTGMIHIHEGGAGSNAFQTNRNVKLSDEAWAWSVPNLEIENNEVHCSHASTVSPVDGDQQFYLQARGVPPTVADRLIVAGFYREVIDRLPALVRDEFRALVQAKLDTRGDR